MTWSKPKSDSTQVKSRRMTWTKPEFEFVDLCCEVTLYLYHE
jgi:PqqA family protein